MRDAKLITPAWMRVLERLYENSLNSVHELSKILDITYSHTHRIIKQLDSMGVLEQHKSGRRITLTLTRKGVIVSLAIKKIHEVLGNEVFRNPVQK